MSHTVRTDPPPAAPSEASNRVTLGLSNRLLARPEVGALVAAIVIFIFFLIVAPAFRSAASLFTVLYQSSTIGIVAVGVGHADDRRRVRPVRRRPGDSCRPAERRCSATSSASTSGSAPSCRWSSAWSIGFLNGYLVMRTGIPSFLITLGTFFVLQGANLGVTKLVTGLGLEPQHQPDGRLRLPELRSSRTTFQIGRRHA